MKPQLITVSALRQILRRERLKSGLTGKQVAEILGSKHKSAYFAYEQGRRVPSALKAVQLLQAVSGHRYRVEFVAVRIV